LANFQLVGIPIYRPTILRLIIEQYLTHEEPKGRAQSIIYKRRWGIVWFSAQYPGYYQTTGFSARELLKRYRQIPQ
jgi:hypothetical protein